MSEETPYVSNEDLMFIVEAGKESQKRKYREGLRTPIIVKCVVCDVVIPNSFEEYNKDELAEEYANVNSFANGAVGVLSFGYGCRFDTDVFIIGICADCYEKKRDAGSVLFTRSYMP